MDMRQLARIANSRGIRDVGIQQPDVVGPELVETARPCLRKVPAVGLFP